MITVKESTYDDITDIQSLWADEDVMKYVWPWDCRSGAVYVYMELRKG